MHIDVPETVGNPNDFLYFTADKAVKETSYSFTQRAYFSCCSV